MKYTSDCFLQIKQLTEKLLTADAILIGAGAGMSTSAGYTYSGKRFEDNFPDFIKKYGFKECIPQALISTVFFIHKAIMDYGNVRNRVII